MAHLLEGGGRGVGEKNQINALAIPETHVFKSRRWKVSEARAGLIGEGCQERSTRWEVDPVGHSQMTVTLHHFCSLRWSIRKIITEEISLCLMCYICLEK